MPVTFSQKVTTLLTDLGEDTAKFRKKAEEMVATPGKTYFKAKLNKVDYYMRYRKNGANHEVYDYSFDKPTS